MPPLKRRGIGHTVMIWAPDGRGSFAAHLAGNRRIF
jgi:hypothetical protein